MAFMEKERQTLPVTSFAKTNREREKARKIFFEAIQVDRREIRQDRASRRGASWPAGCG